LWFLFTSDVIKATSPSRAVSQTKTAHARRTITVIAYAQKGAYEDVLNFFPKLKALRLTIDSVSEIARAETLLRLSIDYDLTAYDAAYLELAGRKKALLATLDENLQNAAVEYGIKPLK
jgi:predicted nucleic acid-binding protein